MNKNKAYNTKRTIKIIGKNKLILNAIDSIAIIVLAKVNKLNFP
jgi:hypothetical protein